MRPSNSSLMMRPPPTSLVLAGKRGFCGSVPAARMMPPPVAAGVAEVLVLLPPQAESTRARHAAPAAAVTQRARTVLPRMVPPQDFKGLRWQHRHAGLPAHVQGRCFTEWCPQRYQMESWPTSSWTPDAFID